MRIFIAVPDGNISSQQPRQDIVATGNDLASSTANLQVLIVEPTHFDEEEYGVFVWGITRYQRDIVDTAITDGVTIVVYDEENDQYLAIIDGKGPLSASYEETHWIKTVDDSEDLEYLLPADKSVSEKNPWDDMKGFDSTPSHLSANENSFIDRIMERDTGFIDKPVESEYSSTATPKQETSFLSNDEEML